MTVERIGYRFGSGNGARTGGGSSFASTLLSGLSLCASVRDVCAQMAGERLALVVGKVEWRGPNIGPGIGVDESVSGQ
jgi:hypothetical protein